MVAVADPNTDILAWRNLVADWHLRHGMPDCGCDDDTADHDYCPPSVAWADGRFSARPDPKLAGTADKWDLSAWIAAWGRNAPLVASPTEFRLPVPPSPDLTWLATRILVNGIQAVELSLLRLTDVGFSVLERVRVDAEPSTVAARAKVILEDLGGKS